MRSVEEHIETDAAAKAAPLRPEGSHWSPSGHTTRQMGTHRTCVFKEKEKKQEKSQTLGIHS